MKNEQFIAIVLLFVVLSVAGIYASDDWCNGSDITQDGKVDANDYDIIDYAFLFLQDCTIGNDWCNGADINRDSIINETDYDIINEAFVVNMTDCSNISSIPVSPPPVYSGDGGGGGGGGFFGPIQLVIGTNNLQKWITYNFALGNENHSLKISSIGYDYVELEIFSTPQTIKLMINETASVDVNNDALSDINIKLVSISNSKAEIYFSMISSSSPVSSETSNNETQPEPELKEPTPQEGFFSGLTGAVIGTLGAGGMVIVTIFIAAIVIGAVSVYAARKKRK